MADLTWNDDEIVRHVMKTLQRNADIVGMNITHYLHDTVLSKGQPVRRSSSGRLVGTKPATSGAPPRVLHGHLRNSTGYRVGVKDTEPRHVQLFFGSYATTKGGVKQPEPGPTEGTMDKREVVNYAAVHEFGDHPFIRTTIRKKASQIVNGMKRGLK